MLLATVLLLGGAAGVRLHVSPHGHDTQSDGGEDGPFRSGQGTLTSLC